MQKRLKERERKRDNVESKKLGLRSTFVAVAIVTETGSAYHVPISLVNCCHEHQFFKKPGSSFFSLSNLNVQFCAVA